MLFNWVQRRRLFYIFSGILILIGLIAIGISISQYPEKSPVRLGVDFTGGTLFEVRFTGDSQTLDIAEVGSAFSNAGLEDVRVQKISTDEANVTRWQIRTNFVSPDSPTYSAIVTNLEGLATANNITFDRVFFNNNQQSVSPTVGNEVTTAAIVATIIASLLVLGFIAVAFRNVPNSLRYGACAVIAMLHDILIMIGAMSLLGLLLGWEADSLFLTGLLTVVAYSVQDSIVMFDRIRENTQRHRGEPYETIVNRSITETVQRSVTTQICVAFVLLALFLMGSGSIRVFVGVLLIGLISGTYSSIGIAIPLLVSWERGEIPFINQGRKVKTA
ncbi:MAG: protein translocase subunit SecF [Anaerolineae bacterium]|nr:protein translocase subunit SecF [Anaerolineae bacterium]